MNVPQPLSEEQRWLCVSLVLRSSEWVVGSLIFVVFSVTTLAVQMEHRLDIRSDMRLFPWTFWLFPSSPHLILQVTRTWKPTEKNNSRNSQFLPSYPSIQVHVYSPRPSLQLPWFRQGLLSHWSPSAKKGFGDRSVQAISVTMDMTLLCWSWHTFFPDNSNEHALLPVSR